MSKELIRLENIAMKIGGATVLPNLNLSIQDKEFLTMLGPSGCGKTTTLRIIGGFATPTSGKVWFDGADITDMPPYKRQVNTVFQKYALFTHLNVFENIAFGLRLRKTPEAQTLGYLAGKRFCVARVPFAADFGVELGPEGVRKTGSKRQDFGGSGRI